MSTFEEHFDLEEYLYLTEYKRSLIAKIKSGTLPLAIETGSYSNTSLEDQLCTLCYSNLIESEFHFICIYSKLDRYKLYTVDTKIKYFAQYSAKWSDF